MQRSRPERNSDKVFKVQRNNVRLGILIIPPHDRYAKIGQDRHQREQHRAHNQSTHDDRQGIRKQRAGRGPADGWGEWEGGWGMVGSGSVGGLLKHEQHEPSGTWSPAQSTRVGCNFNLLSGRGCQLSAHIQRLSFWLRFLLLQSPPRWGPRAPPSTAVSLHGLPWSPPSLRI